MYEGLWGVLKNRRGAGGEFKAVFWAIESALLFPKEMGSLEA